MVIPSKPIIMNDPINPNHYKDGAVECIEALEACSSYEGFCAHLKLTTIAYLWRYEKKNGLEDLKKAQWYLDRLISTIHANEAFPPLEPPPSDVEMECKDGFCPMPGIRYDVPIAAPASDDHIMFSPVA